MNQKSVIENNTVQNEKMQKKIVLNGRVANNKITAEALSREKCESIEQVRMHIDLIDQQLIELIAVRQFYVDQAVRFKRTEQAVHAPERVEQILTKVRTQAQALGVDATLIEALYKSMLQHFIQRELKEIRP